VGKGFVVCCTGNNESVLLIAEVAELVLKALDLKGVDLNKLGGGVDFKGLPQEQIVNLGYKKLIFEAFEPDLPDAINYLRERDPLADRNLVVGAKVVSVTNQRFAQAENLLSPFLPHFDPEHFCAQGKVMDSWETVRHNPFEFDSLILDLLGAMEVRYLLLSTQFHDGNHPEFVKILGSRSIDESVDWLEILPKTHLEGHSILKIDLIKSASGIRRLRIDMYPDGGLTRLGLYSDLSQPDASYFRPLAEAKSIRLSAPIPKAKKPLTIPFIKGPTRNSLEPQNWACLSNGGKVMRVSNEHYGPASQVISPFPPIHMFDGFESARSRDANHSEELVLKLGKPTLIEQISLDFSYFVNNNPVAISIFAKEDSQWVEIQTKTDVKAYAGNIKTFKISYLKPAQELLFKISCLSHLPIFSRSSSVIMVLFTRGIDLACTTCK
jgi:allantoicase